MSQQSSMSPEAKMALAGIGAFLYLIFPLDPLPDIFFPLGFLDDLGVIGICATYIVNTWQTMSKQKQVERTSRANEMIIIDAEVVEPRNVVDAEFTVTAVHQARRR